MKKWYAGMSALLLAVISCVGSQQSVASPEMEPRNIAPAEQDTAPYLFSTIARDPISGELTVRTVIENQDKKARYFGTTTINYPDGTPFALLILDNVRSGASLNDVCDQYMAETANSMDCLKQADQGRHIGGQWNGTPIELEFKLDGGQRLIPFVHGDPTQLRIGDTTMSVNDYIQRAFAIYSGKGIEPTEISSLETIVTLKYEDMPIIEAPTAIPTNKPYPFQSLEETPLPAETPIQVTAGNAESASKVALTITVTNPDKQVTLYKLKPNVVNAYIVRMSEMEGFNEKGFEELQAAVEKEISSYNRTHWLFGRLKKYGVEKVAITGGSQTYYISIQDSEGAETTTIVQDAEGNYFYLTVEESNASAISYTAYGNDGAAITSTSQLLNHLHREQYIKRTFFGKPIRELREGYVLNNSLASSVISQLDSPTTNERLMAEAAKQGYYTKAKILGENGEILGTVEIPTGTPFENSEIDAYVSDWNEQANGATTNEEFIIYTKVHISLIFGLEKFPSYIPYESLIYLERQLNETYKGREQWPSYIDVLVPLSSIIPKDMVEEQYEPQSTGQTHTMIIPSAPNYGTEINRLIAQIPISRSAKSKPPMNSKAWSEEMKRRGKMKTFPVKLVA